MGNSLTFNGVNSADYGIILSGGGTYATPERVITSVEVPGRNGNIQYDEGNYKKVIYHEFLSVNLTRQTKVHFSGNDRYVYFDSIDALGVVDTKSAHAMRIPLKGTILDIQESPVDQSVFVLSRYANSYYTITILEGWTKKIGQFSFEASAAFILADGNNVYVGKDSKISRLAISKS